MKTASTTPTRLISASILGLLLSASLPLASAAPATWDPSGLGASSVGGDGAWDTTSSIWWNGTADTTWNATANNTGTATFTGTTSYTVTPTASGTIDLGGITVNNTGSFNLTIASGSTLRLNGATPTIKVTTNTYTTVINSAISSTTGFTKTGSGGLRLGFANTYTGDTTVNAGTLFNNVENAVSTSSALVLGSSGAYSMNSFNQSLTAISGSGTITNRTTARTLTITGSATNTFSGTISNTTAALNLAINGTGTVLNLTGTNSYSGTTVVTAGTLNLGSSLTATSSVTVSGGALGSTVASVNLGLGAVSMSGSGSSISINGTSIGTLTLADAKNFTATLGTLSFSLGASDTSDQIIGSGLGAFSLTGTTIALDGTTSIAGTYTLFSGFGGTNTVSGVTITGLDSGLTGSLGTNGVLTVSAIPEPATYAALAGLFTLGLAVLRRPRGVRS